MKFMLHELCTDLKIKWDEDGRKTAVVTKANMPMRYFVSDYCLQLTAGLGEFCGFLVIILQFEENVCIDEFNSSGSKYFLLSMQSC